MHAARMRAFLRGEGIGAAGSLLWTGSLVVLLVVGLAVELHYALVFPYLRRSAVVEVAPAASSGGG